MKRVSRYQVDLGIIISLLIFSVISIITIYSAQSLLIDTNDLYIKQIVWYVVGFLLAFFVMFIGNNYIYKNIWFLYGIGIISLILLLIFGTPINDAKCWFTIKHNTVLNNGWDEFKFYCEIIHLLLLHLLGINYRHFVLFFLLFRVYLPCYITLILEF